LPTLFGPPGARKETGEREKLRKSIVVVLLSQPINNESHLSRLQAEGYSIARGGKPSGSRWQES